MADLDNFDANQVEPNQVFDLIPDGWVEAIIVESEKKPTAAGDGEYLKLKFQILDERFKGRFLWDNLNLKNPNPQTVQIARGQLSAICRAVGVLTPKDSTQLHNLPMLIKVSHENRRDTGEPKNTVKGFKAKLAAVAGGQAPSPMPEAQQTQPQAAAAGGAPWKR